MPRKRKAPATSAAIELPASEPTTAAAVAEEAPVAAPPPKSDPNAEAVASFQRQREREHAVSEPRANLPPPVREVIESGPKGPRGHADESEPRVPTSFADAVKASRSGFAPVPEGFVNVDSYRAAGIKVNRSLDGKVVALQFAEDRLPTRPEKDIMEAVTEAGTNFQYKTARRQWERYDAEQPGANLMDAKRVGADLAHEREGRGR